MAKSAVPSPEKIKEQKKNTTENRSIFSPLVVDKETLIYKDILKKGSDIGPMAQSAQQPSNCGSAGVEEAPKTGGSNIHVATNKMKK